MSGQNAEVIEALQDAAEERGTVDFFINILAGNRESASTKKLLVLISGATPGG